MPRDVLLNFSTSIDAAKTLGEIMGILSAHRISRLQVLYDEGVPSGLMFATNRDGRELGFRLPANINAVYETLHRQYRAGKIRLGYATKEQAGRVAWRILKDWIEAQIALIETGMVTTEEVFLPYMLTDGDRTVFEVMAASQLMLPEKAMP